MAWLNLIPRSALCILGAAAALASQAADLTLVTVSQPKPGYVVARVSYVGAGALAPAALSLRLDAVHSVPAASVASAAVAAAPVALLLCLDRSGSMGAPAIAAIQSALRESLAAPVGAAALPYNVAIVTFATRTTPLLNLTSDPARVRAAVANLTLENQRDGKTRLYDAVAGGLAELRASDLAARRLIVVSDGNDEGSHISQADLVKRATATSIPVDAVGFGALASSQSGSLATIAGATGGTFQVASSNAELSATLGRMIRRVVPTPQFDVAFHYSAADGRASETPTLVYKPNSGSGSEMPIQASLAAAAGSAEPPSAASSGASAVPVPDTEPSGWRKLINVAAIMSFVESLPIWAWAILGVLSLSLIALLVMIGRRRHEPVVNPPPAPPPFAAPGPTIIGVTQAPVDPPAAPSDRRTVVSFRWPLPGDGRVVAILHVTAGPAAGRHIEISAAKVTIGSATSNDVALAIDGFISSHHAVLRAEANGLYLVDLGSTNGTELNGVRFKDSTRALSPGDHFTLGRTTLEVHTVAGPQAGHPAFEQRVR